jgi:hypothetical protein
MVKITTFNDRPVRHVRYMPDVTVILTLYERRPNRRARHLRVSLAQWLAGRGIYLLESHATQRAQARQLARHMSADRMPTSRGITWLVDIPDGECRCPTHTRLRSTRCAHLAVDAASTASAIQSRFGAELTGGTRNARNVDSSRAIPWASVS